MVWLGCYLSPLLLHLLYSSLTNPPLWYQTKTWRKWALIFHMCKKTNHYREIWYVTLYVSCNKSYKNWFSLMIEICKVLYERGFASIIVEYEVWMKIDKYIETWYIAFITNKLHYKESESYFLWTNQWLIKLYFNIIYIS